VLEKGKQFLLLKKTPKCNSYSCRTPLCPIKQQVPTVKCRTAIKQQVPTVKCRTAIKQQVPTYCEM
jgi:hypothetical protein